MAFVPILAIWGMLSLKGEALVHLVNATYRGLLFFAWCAAETDSVACLESTGALQAVLVHPERPEEIGFLSLIVLLITALLSFLLVWRFGKRPTSILQRLMGAILGVANGFTLSYILLPFLPYREQIPLASVQSSLEEELPSVVGSLTGSAIGPNLSISVILLIALIVFVIVAVRFIRPTEA